MLKYIILFITLVVMFPQMVEIETQAQDTNLSQELLWKFGTGDALHLDWGEQTPGIAIRTTHSLQIFDPTSLEVLWNRESSTSLGQVAWHDNGRYVASTSEAHLEIFNYETSEVTVIENQPLLWTLAWHPIDLKIAGSTSALDGEKVLIWDALTGEQDMILSGFEERVDTLAWSPDGERLAVGTRSGEVVIYDIETNEIVELWQVTDGGVRSLAWHPDDLMLAVASTNDPNLSLWNTEIYEQIDMIDTPNLSSEISWDASGRYLAGQSSTGIGIWDITSNTLIMLEHQSQPVLDFAWHELSLVSLLQDGTIEVWDTMTQQRQVSEAIYTGRVSHFDVNTEYDLITAMFQGVTTIRVLDSNNGELRQIVQPHSGVAPSDLLNVSWNESGDTLAIALHEMIEIWELNTQLGELSYRNTITYEGRVTDLGWHPILTNVLSIAWGDEQNRTLLFIDTSTNTIQNEIPLDGLIELSWHPDGKQIAVYQNAQRGDREASDIQELFIQILDTDNFQILQTLIFEDMSPLPYFRWIPQTTDLFGIQCRVSVEGCTYWIWNSTNEHIQPLGSDLPRTTSFVLSPDGAYIAIGQGDSDIRILDQALDVELIISDFIMQPEILIWEENNLYISDGILSVYVIE